MPASRRLYEELARAVREARELVARVDPEGAGASNALLDVVMEGMIRGLLSDNPRFDPARFRKACQFDLPKKEAVKKLGTD